MGVIAWFGIIVFLFAGCGSLWLFFGDAVKPKPQIMAQPQRIMKSVARPKHRQKRYYQRRIRELQRQQKQLLWLIVVLQQKQSPQPSPHSELTVTM